MIKLSLRRALKKTTFLSLAGKKRNVILACTLLVIVIALAIAVAATSGFSNSTLSNPGHASTSTHLTNQVQIRVEYVGAWAGAYADSSTDPPVSVNWKGDGTSTITVDRPSNSNGVWVLSANAQKTDDSLGRMNTDNDTLTLSILKMDGTTLETASTSALNGATQVSVIIDD